MTSEGQRHPDAALVRITRGLRALRHAEPDIPCGLAIPMNAEFDRGFDGRKYMFECGTSTGFDRDVDRLFEFGEHGSRRRRGGASGDQDRPGARRDAIELGFTLNAEAGAGRARAFPAASDESDFEIAFDLLGKEKMESKLARAAAKSSNEET